MNSYSLFRGPPNLVVGRLPLLQQFDSLREAIEEYEPGDVIRIRVNIPGENPRYRDLSSQEILEACSYLVAKGAHS